MEKRYAIVRVDINSDNNCENCEMKYINEKENIDCRLRVGTNFLCDRYGDTKEQLTQKIKTAIEIAINRYEEGKIKGRNKNRQCAEIIVEFLGIK